VVAAPPAFTGRAPVCAGAYKRGARLSIAILGRMRADFQNAVIRR